MNFSDVLAILDAGGKVRRPHWPEGRYWLYKADSGIILRYTDDVDHEPTETPWQQPQADVDAVDWAEA